MMLAMHKREQYAVVRHFLLFPPLAPMTVQMAPLCKTERHVFAIAWKNAVITIQIHNDYKHEWLPLTLHSSTV